MFDTFAIVLFVGQTWRNQTERRYELDRETAENTLARLNKYVPRITYTPDSIVTLVTTTYLDSADHHYFEFQQSHNGKRSIKMRVREYFPLSDDGAFTIVKEFPYCFLERKERNGRIRLKERVEVQKSQVTSLINRERDFSSQGSEVEAIRKEIRTHRLAPVVTSAYERRVWGENELRITFDERIRFYTPPSNLYKIISALKPNVLGPPIGVGPKRIVEIKHAADYSPPQWLSEITDGLKEMVDYSKFVNGIECLSHKRRISHLTGLIVPE